MEPRTPQHDAERLTLKPVGAAEWRDVAGLEVTEAQRTFVAVPTHYLALCAYGGLWHPLAVLLGERVIGFEETGEREEGEVVARLTLAPAGK